MTQVVLFFSYSPCVALTRSDKEYLYWIVMKDYTFYVYILTNPSQTTLYIGVTNDLCRRLHEHKEGRNSNKSFTGKYFCYHLIYFEVYQYVNEAIAREKQLKKWSRRKKETLIARENPDWNILYSQFIIEE